MTETIEDRGEDISIMEPLLVRTSSRHKEILADLVVELTATATGLHKSLPKGIINALSNLVRAMNCYYSNLIEGHNTHPIDIERAMNEDYSKDISKRNLQLEARAHVSVQQWIDMGNLSDKPTSIASIFEIHKRFCELLPDDLLLVENLETKEYTKVIPGKMRTVDVKVGQHIPISPGALPRFMKRFASTYGKLGKVDSVIAAATAHHRLLWIHPFLDGNGRVARLMSYAIIRDALDTGGVWSIARGLARNEASYKAHLAACDLPRRNDLDGRGYLSEEALAKFAEFFLETCIDQVKFIAELVQPERLHNRIMMWAEEEIRSGSLPYKADTILEAILYRGELARGYVAELIGSTDRHARRTSSMLLERGILVSTSTRAPLHLAFPATLASRWLPGLFPDKLDGA